MLIIDNYDSFTYNIVQYIKMLGVSPIVIKNDEMSLEEIKALDFSHILLSPGWGNPDNAGVTMDVIDFYKNTKSIFGVCLGMQCLAKYFGASIVRAPEPYHGKNSQIFFEEDFPLFNGFKQGFSATRYHSLMVEDCPYIKARTQDGIPMALQIGNNIYGVQFHPEAILTDNGIKIFENWLACDF